MPASVTPAGASAFGPAAQPARAAAAQASTAAWTFRILAYPRTMTRRKAMELETLKGRITRLDADSVDRLYGLEPVYEPGAERSTSLAPEEFVAIRCPWGGERLGTAGGRKG